jgi:outer membrane protein assembly factor BamD
MGEGYSDKIVLIIMSKGWMLVIQDFFKFPKIYSACVLSLTLFLGACSTSDDEKFDERPVGELYNKGMAELKDKQYERAAKIFDEVERQHPYSEWATQAQLMTAYAHYQNQKYEKSLVAVDSFINLHPAHPEIAYAYYLQGLCYYEQLSPVERDQKVTELAYESFEKLVNRFPRTDYAKDAKYKIVLLRDMMAAKEMDVGRYYQERKGYIGAMNRFRSIIKKYQNTSHTPEALHRLVEVYLALGLKEEARTTAAVLGHNYPDNPWYAETYLLMKGQDFRSEEYRQGESWLDKIWKAKPKA